MDPRKDSLSPAALIRATGRFLRRYWKALFLYLPLCLFLLGVAYTGWVYFDWTGKKDRYLAMLEDLNLQVQGRQSRRVLEQPTKIMDASGEIVVGQFGREQRQVLPLSEIRQLEKIKTVLIFSEDRDFYQHEGYSLVKMGKGLARTLIYGRLFGGSTITQQLAKLLFTDAERNIKRKIYEIFCASMIEKRYDKATILAMYLNKIYFGGNHYGVEEASRYYYGKAARDLDWAETAMLIGIIPNPTAFSPTRRTRRALYKQWVVLRNVSVNGKFLSVEAADRQLARFYARYRVKTKDGKKVKPPHSVSDENWQVPAVKWKSRLGTFGGGKRLKKEISGFFNEYIRRFIVRELGEDKLKSGLTVFTTLDARRQQAAYKVVVSRLDRLRGKMAKALLKKGVMSPDQINKELTGLNAAFLTLDSETGFVRAFVGGYKFGSGNQLNRIMQTKRQPGSAIKPLVYYQALRTTDLQPFSLIRDEAVNFNGYQPGNYYGGYKGEMTLARALALSVNTVAVKALHLAGLDNFRETWPETVLEMGAGQARGRFGNLSVALGASELSVWEMGQLYAALLSGGRRVEPILILKIFDASGNLLYSRDPYQPERVLSPLECLQVLQMMEGVVLPGGTVSYMYSYRRKKEDYLNYLMAGKTGSTQLAAEHRGQFAKAWPKWYRTRDAWYVGLTPGEASVVWVGNDHGSPLPGGGSALAAPVWADVAHRVWKSLTPEEKKAPRYLPYVDKTGAYRPDYDWQRWGISLEEGEYRVHTVCRDNGLRDDPKCEHPLPGRVFNPDKVPPPAQNGLSLEEPAAKPDNSGVKPQ